MFSTKFLVACFYTLAFHSGLIFYFILVPDTVLLFSIGFALQYSFMFLLSLALIIKSSNFTSVAQLVDAINSFSITILKYTLPTLVFYLLSKGIELFLPDLGNSLTIISIFLIGIILIFFIPGLSALSIIAIYLGIRKK